MCPLEAEANRKSNIARRRRNLGSILTLEQCLVHLVECIEYLDDQKKSEVISNAKKKKLLQTNRYPERTTVATYGALVRSLAKQQSQGTKILGRRYAQTVREEITNFASRYER